MSTEPCMVPGCDQPSVELLSNDAPYLSAEYTERWVCRWHRRNPFPTPADYTTCISCGCDFAPPNGTDLCGLCRKPDAPRVYRVERDGRSGDLREFVAGHLDVTDAVADDLRRVATENGLPLNQIPCDLPGVVTFATAQVLPVLTADGWRIAPALVDPTAAPDG